MHKYLFITYGEPGWRGVQVRALRMADYLPKTEVIFWNLYDSDFISTKGFDVTNCKSGLISPKDIHFPEGTEIVIFSDLPSNEFFNMSVFQAAIKKNLKIVICEQIYRKGQMQESLYKAFSQYSDLFLVNTLSIFESEATDTIKVVPPQIEKDFTPEIKREIKKRYDIPEDALMILGIGYHPHISDKIIEITKHLEKKYDNFYTIITGTDEGQMKRDGHLIKLPYDIGDEFFKLLYASDLVLTKFGFLQILEAVALGKPVVILGDGGWILRDSGKIDPVLKDALLFYPEITEETHAFIETFIRDPLTRHTLNERIKSLHNGELYGAKKASEEILRLSTAKSSKKLDIKRIAILVNDEIYEKESWLKTQSVYPLCFITGMPSEGISKKLISEKLLEKKVRDLNVAWPEEIIPHSFKQINLFSERRLDGLMDILPWYQEWIDQIEQLLTSADEIYISEKGTLLLGILLDKFTDKIKPL